MSGSQLLKLAAGFGMWQTSVSGVTNGTGSFKRAKHIKVCYFWLKELIDNGISKLVYQHTAELVADILTKPLSGAQFQYLLYKLIGWNNESDDSNDE
jgi:hypothetical protein